MPHHHPLHRRLQLVPPRAHVLPQQRDQVCGGDGATHLRDELRNRLLPRDRLTHEITSLPRFRRDLAETTSLPTRSERSTRVVLRARWLAE